MWLINTDLNTTKRYRPKMGSLNHNVLLPESQKHVINPTNPRGALDDCVKHRLHVGRRAADDAEHLGRCRLMLQSLAQFRVALLEFLKQPHIFDGDDGLVSKGFEQGNLLVGEGSNFQSANRYRSNGNVFAQQRRDKHCTNADTSGIARWEIVLRLCGKVMNVNGLPVNNRSTCNETAHEGSDVTAFGHRA